MNIIETVGDVTDPSTFIPMYNPLNYYIVILHQVNTKGIMGAGVALTIAQRYPEVQEQYQNFCISFSGFESNLLGNAQFAHTEKSGITFVNLFGQTLGGLRNTNYEALYNALESFVNVIKFYPEHTLALPKNMSSGLAGGNWNIVRTMIEELFQDLPNDLYIVEWSG